MLCQDISIIKQYFLIFYIWCDLGNGAAVLQALVLECLSWWQVKECVVALMGDMFVC